MTLEPVILILAVGIAIGAGFALGRRTGSTRERIRDLLMKLEAVKKEREFANASLDAAKAEIAQMKSEREEYGSRVVEHFSATSELMRDLTLQYRAVYDQLTQGATSLCPEGSVGLQDGLQPEMLDEGRREEGEDEAPAAGTAPEEGAGRISNAIRGAHVEE